MNKRLIMIALIMLGSSIVSSSLMAMKVDDNSTIVPLNPKINTRPKTRKNVTVQRDKINFMKLHLGFFYIVAWAALLIDAAVLISQTALQCKLLSLIAWMISIITTGGAEKIRAFEKKARESGFNIWNFNIIRNFKDKTPLALQTQMDAASVITAEVLAAVMPVAYIIFYHVSRRLFVFSHTTSYSASIQVNNLGVAAKNEITTWENIFGEEWEPEADKQ